MGNKSLKKMQKDAIFDFIGPVLFSASFGTSLTTIIRYPHDPSNIAQKLSPGKPRHFEILTAICLKLLLLLLLKNPKNNCDYIKS